jgi:hypothetical protein
MGALLILLALSAAIGFALCPFSWPQIMMTGVALALLSAAVLHAQDFGPVAGIASTVACLTVSQVAYLTGRQLAPRQPDELRQHQLKQQRGGTTMWLWALGMAMGILVVTVLATANRSNRSPGNSTATTGTAATSPPNTNPKVATPSPASPATDNR